MKAILYNKGGRANACVTEVPDPTVGDKDVLIRVYASDICRPADAAHDGGYSAFGKYPLVPGHEYAGIVEKVGKDVVRFQVGDRVTADANLPCGTCYYCIRGEVQFCENNRAYGQSLNGGFAQLVAVDESLVYKVPDSVSLRAASMTELVGCVYNCMERCNFKYGSEVLILGGGVVGQAALSVLHALGAWVTVMDINIGTLRSISRQYHEQVNTMISTKENIAKLLPETDMVLNCVKWPKNRTDHLIDRAMVKTMSKGSVIVDISNDVGVIETVHETTHENPRYIEEGVVHYCVSNIPGAIANSTSVAYAASVLPHFRSIMNQGVAAACARDGFLRRSLTAYKGYLTHEETSALQGRPWIRPEDILGLTGQNIDPAPPATVTRSENFIPLEDVKL